VTGTTGTIDRTMDTDAGSLGAAIASQPAWLQAWVMAMVVVHLLAVVFAATRTPDGWRVRPEPLAILASFLAAGMFMGWLYEQYGYVRLLGLAHLVFWTPVYLWVLTRRKDPAPGSLFGKYLVVYLLIAGLSLVVDAIDLVRYVAGTA
jgi:hypothetical protein